MTRFEYSIPGESEVKRTFAHDEMAKDLYDILIAGELVATVDFKTARGYWIGRLTLAEILGDDTNSEGQQVK